MPSHVELNAVSSELSACPHWVVWRYGEMRPNGKREKVPYNPRTEQRASTSDATTWATFQDTRSAYESGGYDGIGFVLTPPYVGVDLDECRDAGTGDIAAWAADIINHLDSYAEVSPSGTGVHILMRGTLPAGGRRRGGIEMYDRGRFFTLTGEHLGGTPLTIEAREAELHSLHARVFPNKQSTPLTHTTSQANDDTEQLADAEVLAHCRRGRNAAKFIRLWDGDSSDYDDDHSRADAALCGMLARWTQYVEQIDRLFRQSGLYREKWEEIHRTDGATYGQMTIELALRDVQKASPRKQLRMLSHAYDWQRRKETLHDRHVMLHGIGENIRDRVRTHLAACDPYMLLVIAAPPGVGKSHAVAELGAHTGAHPLGWFNIAWIAPRKDMIDSVAGLQRYHQRVGCTPENCPDADLHQLYAAKGYNTWAVHKAHIEQCEYMRHIYQTGSTVYQIPHVNTPYPTGHADGIVIDELDPTQWLPERAITRERLQAAGESFESETVAARFLRALGDTIADCEPGTHGRKLFAALDWHCGGQLASRIQAVTQDVTAMNPRPYQEPDRYARQQANRWPPIVLPYVVRAIQSELEAWQSGEEWNSLLRTGETHETGMPALYLTEPRQFIEPDSGIMPPRVLLDGTADRELLARLFGDDRVRIYRPDVPPPPHMQHVAVRTGTRYGKTALERNADDRVRVAAQMLYLLQVLGIDPDGEQCRAGKVGLISYKGAVPYLRKALGIPQGRTGYFWGIRGSNALEDCDILLVVGTPTLRHEELYRLARALYHSDPLAINPTAHREKDTGTWRYEDERMQRLSDYLIRAELTQCAHRNRPLRHDRRIVVTFGISDVDYLPVTKTITQFPRLTSSGRQRDTEYTREVDAALTEAYEHVLARGEAVTVRKLQDEVRSIRPIHMQTITTWLREQRGASSNPCVSQKA